MRAQPFLFRIKIPLRDINTPFKERRRCVTKGYYTESSYVGFMPDGSKRWFVSDVEYREAFGEALNDSES